MMHQWLVRFLLFFRFTTWDVQLERLIRWHCIGMTSDLNMTGLNSGPVLTLKRTDLFKTNHSHQTRLLLKRSDLVEIAWSEPMIATGVVVGGICVGTQVLLGAANIGGEMLRYIYRNSRSCIHRKSWTLYNVFCRWWDVEIYASQLLELHTL